MKKYVLSVTKGYNHDETNTMLILPKRILIRSPIEGYITPSKAKKLIKYGLTYWYIRYNGLDYLLHGYLSNPYPYFRLDSDRIVEHGGLDKFPVLEKG